jgi:hypothetical protein
MEPKLFFPGTYKGTITISAKDHHSTPSEVEGVEEYTMHLPKQVGTMTLVLSADDRVSAQFHLPYYFVYNDWEEVPDDGQGNCRGMIANAYGYGQLDLRIPMGLAPIGGAGDTFGGTPNSFTLDKFKPTIFPLGNNCPEVTKEKMRTTLETALRSVLKNRIDFMVEKAAKNSISGMCTMFEWENDPERSYSCKWLVHRVSK